MKVLDLQLKQFSQLDQLDQLGMLQAQIAQLEEQAEAIKDAFKNAGEGKYQGNLYEASVSLSQRKTVDYKKLIESFGLSTTHYQLAATQQGWNADMTDDAKTFLEDRVTKTSASIAIRVTARK